MSMTKELKTVRDYIRYATSLFNEAGLIFGHGTNNAWDEAVALVLHALHLPHHVSDIVLSARLTHKEKNTILTFIEKRVEERIPLPYITHEAWFCGLPFFVDERVLIPRSPIAELIQNEFAPWVNAAQVHSILDLCTGSGCIAIACAKAFPDAIIHASDFSENALAVAQINALKHNVSDQLSYFHSDLFTDIPAHQYDLIVSNPPYVEAEDMVNLPEEYRHEPHSGLSAGSDGLDCILPILKNAARFLAPEGVLIVEVGNTERILMQQFTHIPFTWLEFQTGDDGVFLLTKAQLDAIRFED